MKKSTQKKIIGGTLIAVFLSILGAVLVTAELDGTEDTDDDTTDFPDFGFGRKLCGREPYMSKLTEEKQEEIYNLRQSLLEENATMEEIREAINDKLTEFGIEVPTRDDLLGDQIERTTQKLEMLEVQKQLREDGYTWDEVDDILVEEYNVTMPMDHHGMMGPRGGRGMHGIFEEEYCPAYDEETETSST